MTDRQMQLLKRANLEKRLRHATAAALAEMYPVNDLEYGDGYTVDGGVCGGLETRQYTITSGYYNHAGCLGEVADLFKNETVEDAVLEFIIGFSDVLDDIPDSVDGGFFTWRVEPTIDEYMDFALGRPYYAVVGRLVFWGKLND